MEFFLKSKWKVFSILITMFIIWHYNLFSIRIIEDPEQVEGEDAQLIVSSFEGELTNISYSSLPQLVVISLIDKDNIGNFFAPVLITVTDLTGEIIYNEFSFNLSTHGQPDDESYFLATLYLVQEDYEIPEEDDGLYLRIPDGSALFKVQFLEMIKSGEPQVWATCENNTSVYFSIKKQVIIQ